MKRWCLLALIASCLLPRILLSAITVTNLTSGADTAAPDPTVTASITPSANRLVICAVLTSLGSSPPPTTTVTGCSLTWVEISNVTFFTAASPEKRLTLFRAMGASPTSGTLSLDHSVAVAGALWSVVEFDGVDTGGTNGSAAVLQPTSNITDGATSLTVTLAAFTSSNNGTYGAFGIQANEAQTQGGGFSELADVAHATPATALSVEWRADNDTSVDQSSAGTVARGGIAFEIKAAAALAVIPYLARRRR